MLANDADDRALLWFPKIQIAPRFHVQETSSNPCG